MGRLRATVTATWSTEDFSELAECLAFLVEGHVRVDGHGDLDVRVTDDRGLQRPVACDENASVAAASTIYAAPKPHGSRRSRASRSQLCPGQGLRSSDGLPAHAAS